MACRRLFTSADVDVLFRGIGSLRVPGRVIHQGGCSLTNNNINNDSIEFKAIVNLIRYTSGVFYCDMST